MLRTKKEHGEDELRLKIRVNEMSGGKRNYSKERKKCNKWKALEKGGTDKRKVRVQRVGGNGVKI